ncbi:MAG: sulfate ABC transporter ATP-binding protein [Candidatus Omnitrophica bacterium]|nr:sulfate ABC transporter ATP-binding protein [Candidatus Omnitrophota bacterium]
MSIEVKNIHKQFGNFQALENLSLKVESGELLALLGPSGSGKTTLLRIVAGLDAVDKGQVLFGDQDAQNQKARERGVGFVFQHYALFRNMTVFDNIAFGLKVQPRHLRPSKVQIREKVMELLNLVQLEWLADRYPWQLSGGQRQRIALARALAVRPKVLLLDEPFGSLDAQVRKELRLWLRRFHDEFHITTLFVTHDQEEALEVADRIVVMNKGRIEQIGTPEEVYHNPANPFVLSFLGNVNLFHCRLAEGKAFIGDTALDVPGLSVDHPKTAKLYVRPNQFKISRGPGKGDALKAVVEYVNPAGTVVKVNLKTENGERIYVEISQDEFNQLRLIKSQQVYVSLKDVTYSEYVQDSI